MNIDKSMHRKTIRACLLGKKFLGFKNLKLADEFKGCSVFFYPRINFLKILLIDVLSPVVFFFLVEDEQILSTAFVNICRLVGLFND